jgi:hypothetical protein
VGRIGWCVRPRGSRWRKVKQGSGEDGAEHREPFASRAHRTPRHRYGRTITLARPRRESIQRRHGATLGLGRGRHTAWAAAADLCVRGRRRLLDGAALHIADAQVLAVGAETRFGSAYTAIRMLADVGLQAQGYGIWPVTRKAISHSASAKMSPADAPWPHRAPKPLARRLKRAPP